MSQVLRGPDVSYNALAGNGDLYNTIGYFDFVLPSDWDNGSSVDKLFVDITGGVAAVGPAPTAFAFFFQYGIDVVNGGSAITATLSGSGQSYAIGSVLRNYASNPVGGSWTTVGNGQTFIGGYIDPTENAQLASTLVDGVTWGYSGEGFYQDPSRGFGPVGYDPNVSRARNSDGTTTAVKLNAGQTVTVWFYLSSDCTDNVNPDRTVYAYVSDLTLRYKSTSYPIDLTTVHVGWSAGDSYTLFHNSPQFTVYPNPGRFVETTPPPVTHPDFQIWTDWYLQDVTPLAFRPYPIQVALIPARVGNGGANL